MRTAPFSGPALTHIAQNRDARNTVALFIRTIYVIHVSYKWECEALDSGVMLSA